MKRKSELQLEEDFKFMKRDRTSDTDNMYQMFGCECGDGWYNLIHDLCEAISGRYAKENMPVDIVVFQVKQKFASLRFYYGFTKSIHEMYPMSDCIKMPLEEDDSDRRELEKDIAEIVWEFEEKSKTTCEVCGRESRLRNELIWKQTLCDKCYEKYQKKTESCNRKKQRKGKMEEYLMSITKSDMRKTEKAEHVNGGAGYIVKESLLSEKELGVHCRLFSRVTLPEGGEIGYHEHHDETETYYILKGNGMYNDNGNKVEVKAGDVTFCEDGCGHGLVNTGKENLEMIALILKK